MEKLSTEAVVIGAGVVGLAVAERLSRDYSVIVLEKNPKFGQETSSRNSEVVHSGIYYPVESQKTKLCIEGRDLLYSFCDEYQIPYKKTGKLVVGTERSDLDYLEKLYRHANQLVVPVEKKSKETISQWEPLTNVLFGLFFPETGIVNSHILMERLEFMIQKKDSLIAYQQTVHAIERKTEGFVVEVQIANTPFSIECETVINCAGLLAHEISNRFLNTQRFEHRYCRGRYFSLNHTFKNKFKHLIYPTPVKDGLGVHVTIDLEGNGRLGPDTDWVAAPANRDFTSIYHCDWESLAPSFTQAAGKYLKDLPIDALSAGMIGIRPKLFIDGKAFPDFLIENHKGFIHCLGIESPGLTSSLAIANQVRKLL